MNWQGSLVRASQILLKASLSTEQSGFEFAASNGGLCLHECDTGKGMFGFLGSGWQSSGSEALDTLYGVIGHCVEGSIASHSHCVASHANRHTANGFVC
jgi:hypothetical protein